MRPLEVRRLGTVPYDEGLAVQRDLVEARKRGEIDDQLLLLQHPHVITLGVRARTSRGHLRASPDHLHARSVAVFETSRGGDVTYHGPGQLVAYPILDLRPDRCDVHRYVRDLEAALIDTVAAFGVNAGRVEGLTGVWVGGEKVAAIGVRISRWITSHGIALNVSTDLGYFDLIVPCGIPDRGVTSLERLVDSAITIENAEDRFIEAFARRFERDPRESSAARVCQPHP